jgi:hypothetical protein
MFLFTPYTVLFYIQTHTPHTYTHAALNSISFGEEGSHSFFGSAYPFYISSSTWTGWLNRKGEREGELGL